MRDFIVICSTASAIAAVICYVRWRIGSIYMDTQEQYELELGE